MPGPGPNDFHFAKDPVTGNLVQKPGLAKPRFTSIRSQSPAEKQKAAKKLRAGNANRKAKRTARYKTRLARKDWKALRLACFERDGFRCTAIHEVRRVLVFEGEETPMGTDNRRCLNIDRSRRGVGLVADHLTYARFGHELLSDLRTLCRPCNARLTTLERANLTR